MAFRFLSTCAALTLASAAVVTPRQSDPFTRETITDFDEPWALAFLPDERILVTEKRGNLQLVDAATKTKTAISGIPSVVYSGQGGFGDVAVHPDFEANSLVYISYVEAGENGETGAVVARGKLALDDNGGGALEDLETIWEQTKVVSNGHFSHRIVFAGENNTMWVSSGDRQLFDPAQDMSVNLGKLLRLNDDGSIPEGNPFADQGGVAAQIWALGIRNPLGFDLDSEGNVWESEMGPQGGDEFNLIRKGGNYGWPLVSEGVHYDNEPIPNHDTRPEFLAPLVHWTPVISPASLIIYKGDMFPEWKGNAIISGLGSLGLVRIEMDGETAREAQRISMGGRTRCVRASPDGALWTLGDGAGGQLIKLTPA